MKHTQTLFGRAMPIGLPFLTITLIVGAWSWGVKRSPHSLIPGPWPVVLGLGELCRKGLLFKYVVASLFRVTWGYLLAATLAVPFGLLLAWYGRAGRALSPLLQIFRPISPLAWIPLAILWFGVGDLAAVFLIFLASFLPLTVASMNAVRNIDDTHIRAGRNFGLSEAQLVLWVLYPAVMPQLIVALRIALGIAWLVVVAAEMIAVNSGLGFLIVDARNAGNRYDLVISGMVLIGLIGLILDTAMRSLERLRSLRWGYGGVAR
jgi:NitT/TauT family transport system permease protein